MNDENKWYAVYTNPRCEKKVSYILTKKGIQNYCPLKKVQKQWSDRKKVVTVPLFTSYVFVFINLSEHASVLQTTGVLNFVYWLNKPAIIRNEEIVVIKRFLNDYRNIYLEKIQVKVNDFVKISGGALLDKVGRVFSVSNKSIKVHLPSLGYMMCAEVDLHNVELNNNYNFNTTETKQLQNFND